MKDQVRRESRVEKDPMSTQTPISFLRCEIHGAALSQGREAYAIETSWVRSIQRVDALRGEVDAPRAVGQVGWLPMREGNIPVFSLAERLGRAAAGDAGIEGSQARRVRQAQQRIIVVNSPAARPGELSQAWLVDDVSQVNRVPYERLSAAPRMALSEAMEGLFAGVIRIDAGRGGTTEVVTPSPAGEARGGEATLILLLAAEKLAPGAAASERIPSPVRRAAPESSAAQATDAAPDVPSTRRAGQLIIFASPNLDEGERRISFGLSISQVLEVLDPLPIIPLPGAPDFVIGLVNWRDQPTPVIDLAGWLGLGQKTVGQSAARLLMAGGGDAWIGCPISSGVRMARLPINYRPCEHSPVSDPARLLGAFELEDETLLIPDLARIHA